MIFNLRKYISLNTESSVERNGIPDWFYFVKPVFESLLPNIEYRALQIGAYAGDFTKWFIENREVSFLDDVDTWMGSDDEIELVQDWNKVFQYYKKNTKNFRQVNRHRMTSDFFFASQITRNYNFIYIDGSHSASQVLLDGINAFKFLEVGGILAFDDYLWEKNENPFGNPKLGVDAFLNFHIGCVEVIHHEYQLWIRKLGELV